MADFAVSLESQPKRSFSVRVRCSASVRLKLVALLRERLLKLLLLLLKSLPGRLLSILAACTLAKRLHPHGDHEGQPACSGRDPRSYNRRVHTRNLVQIAAYGRALSEAGSGRRRYSSEVLQPPRKTMDLEDFRRTVNPS